MVICPAGFLGESYESSFASFGSATAEGALAADWKNMPRYHSLMTRQNGWGPMTSMGVGIVGATADRCPADSYTTDRGITD